MPRVSWAAFRNGSEPLCARCDSLQSRTHAADLVQHVQRRMPDLGILIATSLWVPFPQPRPSLQLHAAYKVNCKAISTSDPILIQKTQDTNPPVSRTHNTRLSLGIAAAVASRRIQFQLHELCLYVLIWLHYGLWACADLHTLSTLETRGRQHSRRKCRQCEG